MAFMIGGEMEKFDEIEYFSDVARIRHALAHIMKKYGMVNEIIIDNQGGNVNPCLGRISKNGAFAVEFFFGMPDAIYTPYGQCRIDSGNHILRDIYAEKALLKELEKNFGLVEVEPLKSTTKFGDIGPVYTLTKLPWKKGLHFPVTMERTRENGQQLFGEVAEEKHVADIFAAVNEKFQAEGHPEFMIKDVTKDNPKKKCKLNITGAARENDLLLYDTDLLVFEKEDVIR